MNGQIRQYQGLRSDDPCAESLDEFALQINTDGFGRSDTREKLRDFFEVDRRWVVLTALRSLVDSGQLDRSKLAEAIKKYDIDTTKPNPMTV